MLVLFHSKSAAEILMFERHARPLLEAAGKTFDGPELPPRGVFTREQLDRAIAGIEAAVAANPEPAQTTGSDHDDATEHPIEQHVSLGRRAWPLLAMLRLAREKGEDVTWEPAPEW